LSSWFQRSLVRTTLFTLEKERGRKWEPSLVVAIVKELFEQHEFQKGLGAVFDVIGEVNKHVNAVQPWTLAKGKPLENEDRLNTTVYLVLESTRIFALLLQSAMPEAMKSLLDRLGVPSEQRSFSFAEWGKSPFGAKAAQGVLFPRTEDPKPPQVSTAPAIPKPKKKKI